MRTRLVIPLLLIGLGATCAWALRGDLEGLRARWSRKSPAERELLKERYKELSQLPPGERARLAERAARIQLLQERLIAHAPAELKQELLELEKLDPDERERRARRYLRERIRDWGRRVRNKLPERFIEELEVARPRDRLVLFERFRLEQRRRKSLRAILQLADEMELEPAEIRRLREIPVEGRMKCLRELRRRSLGRQAQGGEVPGITAQEWKRLEVLSDEDFFDEMRWRELSPGSGSRDEASSPP